MAKKPYAQVDIPVLVGDNYEHIMARADVDVDTENTEVTITIKKKGRESLALAEILTTGEIVALSFVAVPVKPTPRRASSNDHR